MKRIHLITAIACAGLLVSGVATATAKPGKSSSAAAKQCAAEKKADKAAFKAVWGKHAMRDCIRASRPEAADAKQNAAETCRAEREADPDGFAATYGTGKNGKNAFGKCVSQKTGEAAKESAEEFHNAAQECRAERQADPDAFMDTYGANANKKNAFGKCVSQKAND